MQRALRLLAAHSLFHRKPCAAPLFTVQRLITINGWPHIKVPPPLPRHAQDGRVTRGRTTESRAAVEDVAIMTDKQLMRRNKVRTACGIWYGAYSFKFVSNNFVYAVR